LFCESDYTEHINERVQMFMNC